MRDNKYDNLKALLIFLVVFGHMLITYDYLPRHEYNIILSAIYIIHMPIFFIIAGYFSKKSSNLKILKYLSIFLFMNTSFSLYNYLFYGKIDLFSILYSSWFILLLFLYRMIIRNKTVSKIILKKYSIVPILIMSLCSGFIFKNIHVVRFFSYFYFFVIGYKYKFRINKRYCKYILLISITLYILLLVMNIPYEFYMFPSYNNSFEIIIRGIVCIVDTLLFVSIINLIKDKNIKLVTDIGKNSLYIYVLHRIPVLLLSYYLYPCKYYLIISIVISILLCLIISYISKYLDKLFQIKYLLLMSVIFIVIPIIKSFESHEMNVSEYKELDNSITIGYVGIYY